MSHQNPRIAFEAAKWIAEMVLGKPRQPIEGDAASKELALTLAQTLRDVLESNKPEPVYVPVVDGTVRQLGPAKVVAPTILDSDEDFPDA